MRTNCPIQTKEEFVQFAKAYNRFIVTFLLALFCYMFFIFLRLNATTLSIEVIGLVGLLATILDYLFIVFMFIAAFKSKSTFCILSSFLFFAIAILRIFFPTLSLEGLIMFFVVLTSFYYAFKKYNLIVSFLVSQKMIDNLWFCPCGNVCNSNACSNCGQNRDELNQVEKEGNKNEQ